MLGQMSAREWAEWQIYQSLEPIGSARGDWQAALVAATIANAHRRRGRPAIPIKKFLLRFGAAGGQAQSARQQEWILRDYFTRLAAAQREAR